MASVNRVYTALKDLVNKDQRGFVTPSVFNSLAGVAQLNLYNQLFEQDRVMAKRIRNNQLDSALDKNRIKQLDEDLARFVKTQTVSLTTGVGAFPSDFARVITITDSSNRSVPVVNDIANWKNVLRSTLSAPSVSFPAAFLGTSINVSPTSIGGISLTYYKQPQALNVGDGSPIAVQPKWGYVLPLVANKEIFNPANSYDFELPEHYVFDLVVELAKLIGINLRDQDVYAYASNQEKSEQ